MEEAKNIEQESKKIVIDGNSKFGKSFFDNLVKFFEEDANIIVREDEKHS